MEVAANREHISTPRSQGGSTLKLTDGRMKPTLTCSVMFFLRAVEATADSNGFAVGDLITRWMNNHVLSDKDAQFNTQGISSLGYLAAEQGWAEVGKMPLNPKRPEGRRRSTGPNVYRLLPDGKVRLSTLRGLFLTGN